MRALRVVGLDEDGETVICEDPDNGERFSVPADERLRAAARGDLTRLGQVQIEMEGQMRPREIQARIRAGASVEQVAEASGLPEQRIERYAYPVLLERAQVAEMAQRAHPVREDGPDVQTLGEVVAHTFGMRGQEYSDGEWDAWRGEDGKWAVQLRWQAGRSENRAHWAFHPGPQGGTVAALDEHAVDLLDPQPNRPLRTVRPVTQLAREALELDHNVQHNNGQHNNVQHGYSVAGTDPAGGVRDPAEPSGGASDPSATREDVRDAGVHGGAEQATPGATARVSEDEESEDQLPLNVETSAESGDGASAPEPNQRRRKNHPIVPSWEDVLLGVRSNRG